MNFKKITLYFFSLCWAIAPLIFWALFNRPDINHWFLWTVGLYFTLFTLWTIWMSFNSEHKFNIERVSMSGQAGECISPSPKKN